MDNLLFTIIYEQVITGQKSHRNGYLGIIPEEGPVKQEVEDVRSPGKFTIRRQNLLKKKMLINHGGLLTPTPGHGNVSGYTEVI